MQPLNAQNDIGTDDGQDIEVHCEGGCLEVDGDRLTKPTTLQLLAITHHNRKRSSGAKRESELGDEVLLDEIVGAPTVH